MEVVEANLADIDTVWSLIREASSWLDSLEIKQWTRFPRELLEKEVQARTLYVLKEGQTIVGSIVVSTERSEYWDSKTALYVDQLVIARQYAATGATEHIFSWLLAKAQQSGIQLLRFCCDAKNRSLQNYYERRGCRVVGQWHHTDWNMNFALLERATEK